MPKLITEENIKPKHADSFRVLKKHGYDFLGRSNNADLYTKKRVGARSHHIDIYDDGGWVHNSFDHNKKMRYYQNEGNSHEDLDSHLKKFHR